MNPKSVKIRTSDDQTFSVIWEDACQSELIQTMVDDLGVKEGDGTDYIPLHNDQFPISGWAFQKAMDWCEENRFIKNLSEEPFEGLDQLKKNWVKAYIDSMKPFDLLTMLIISKYLEIRGLVNLMLRALAHLFKGKTLEQIRLAFEIEDCKVHEFKILFKITLFKTQIQNKYVEQIKKSLGIDDLRLTYEEHQLGLHYVRQT